MAATAEASPHHTPALTPQQQARLLADALNLTDPARAEFEAVARGRSSASGAGIGWVAATSRTPRWDVARDTGRQPELRKRPIAGTPEGVHGLAPALTSFIGRAKAVSEVAVLLADYRLVTVTGPGGAGKTRLAGQVAEQVAGRFAEGVWLAELAPVRDPALVPAAVAAALGVQDVPGMPATDGLARVLARQQLLLVLDNCEHVIDAAAALCAGLLPACDDVRVLATSREPLRVAGEARLRLPPLAADAAEAGVHVHPAPTGTAGELAVEMTFPTPGRYIVNTEFRRNGQMADIHDRQLVTIAGPAPAARAVTSGPRTITVDGVHVELHGQAQAGPTSDLTFSLTDAHSGQPLRHLQPYLAAAGHIVIMRADGQTFAHEHADVRDSSGHPVFALPGTTFGPDLPVHVRFDTPGTYRLWAQFRLGSGQIITAPFTVHVSTNRSATWPRRRGSGSSSTSAPACPPQATPTRWPSRSHPTARSCTWTMTRWCWCTPGRCSLPAPRVPAGISNATSATPA
jgi:hypothetical protein